METCAIFLADDHTLFRQGLKRIIEERPDLKVVGEAGNGLELIDLVKKSPAAPEVIILDISMPRLRGIEAISEIKMIRPGVKILILTMHKEKEYLFQAMSAGADGYLLKEEAVEGLLAALERIRQKRFFISSFFDADLIEEWLMMSRNNGKSLRDLSSLTTREKEILKLIAEGNTSKQIGEVLYISRRTVEHHRACLMQKLNLKKVTDLVRYALKEGYI